MSQTKTILEVSPTSMSVNGEVFTIKGFKCPVCNGEGSFNQSGYMEKFKDNLSDPDFKTCSQCKGSGELEAKIVVGWIPSQTNPLDNAAHPG